MKQHPDFYTHLLKRRLADDSTLSDTERRELDAHLLICPVCHASVSAILAQSPPVLETTLWKKLAELSPFPPSKIH